MNFIHLILIPASNERTTPLEAKGSITPTQHCLSQQNPKGFRKVQKHTAEDEHSFQHEGKQPSGTGVTRSLDIE